MKAVKLFGSVLLLNLAPILLALSLGVYIGAFEPTKTFAATALLTQPLSATSSCSGFLTSPY
jgi:hypothetical protein